MKEVQVVICTKSCKLHPVLLAAVGFFFFALPPVSAQDARLVWQFDQADDPTNDGRNTAYLSYGIPETDAVQVTGLCSAGTAGNFSIVHLSADVGKLEEGAETTLRFAGGGEELTLEGVVEGTGAEEGISGVLLQVDNDDPIWEMLQRLDTVSYQVPGYAATTLRLEDGRDKITRFVSACRAYVAALAEEDDESDETAPSSPDSPTADGISEQEAFEAARALGTVQAWQAFLDNFPDGFRADLARAYIKELGGKVLSDTGRTEQTTPSGEETVDLGPGTQAWRKIDLAMDEGNTTVHAAAVDANGLEFVAYCTAKKEIGALIRESKPGAYPDFEGRVGRGLEAALGRFEDNENAHIPMRFDGGSEYYVTTTLEGLTGNLRLTSAEAGLRANGRIVQAIMAGNRMTISAPPFAATFQLNGSRNAMCAMMRSCGVTVAGCAVRRETITSSRCGTGFIWLEGQCVYYTDVNTFCGPGYRRRGSRCVSRYLDDTEVACPPGLVWEGDRCVEDD